MPTRKLSLVILTPVITIDPKAFGLLRDVVSLYDVTLDGTRTLGHASGVLQRTERLAPSQIKTIEISTGVGLR